MEEDDSVKATYLFSSADTDSFKSDLKKKNIAQNLSESNAEKISSMKIGAKIDLELEEHAYVIEKTDDGQLNIYGESADEDVDDGLIARRDLVPMFWAGGIFALLCGIYYLLRLLDPKADWADSLKGAAFLIAVSAIALSVPEKEIRLDKENKTVELSEKRLFATKTTKRYPFSQLARVFYHGPNLVGRIVYKAWIRFEFRDGTKFDCDIADSYVPSQKDFEGAKVDYEYGSAYKLGR